MVSDSTLDDLVVFSILKIIILQSKRITYNNSTRHINSKYYRKQKLPT